jgi:hypothetical protein
MIFGHTANSPLICTPSRSYLYSPDLSADLGFLILPTQFLAFHCPCPDFRLLNHIFRTLSITDSSLVFVTSRIARYFRHSYPSFRCSYPNFHVLLIFLDYSYRYLKPHIQCSPKLIIYLNLISMVFWKFLDSLGLIQARLEGFQKHLSHFYITCTKFLSLITTMVLSMLP